MKKAAYCILAILVTGSAALGLAAEQGVWIGRQFQPQQGLEITQGAFNVKRKLCTITYTIRSKGDHFAVDGRLRFDERYIPKNVSDVELEVLLLDERRVCTQQLNMRSPVEKGQASFSFQADKRPDQRYVRTYYVIHYQ